MNGEKTIGVFPQRIPTTPKPDRQRILLRPFNKANFIMQLTLFTLFGLTIFGFITFDYKNINFFEAIQSTLANIKMMVLQPELNHVLFGEAAYQVFVTLGLAFLTTVFGAIISFFFALLAAQNLSKRWISIIIRNIVAVIRAIPTVLWVLIFAISVGLGSVAAIVGMTFHTLGYLIKVFSEAFEEMDQGVIEALKASGASWWQIVFQAVVPMSISYMISWTFLRFEINFAVAIAMGAAAGAGGIGFDMFMASNFYFDMNEIGALSYMILIMAICLELFAVQIKKRLKIVN
jgi:phosphonate transport system permease protein